MHVIYIEDDARVADLTRRELARQAPHISLDVVATLGEARARLTADAGYDLVLVDVNLPASWLTPNSFSSKFPPTPCRRWLQGTANQSR